MMTFEEIVDAIEGVDRSHIRQKEIDPEKELKEVVAKDIEELKLRISLLQFEQKTRMLAMKKKVMVQKGKLNDVMEEFDHFHNYLVVGIRADETLFKEAFRNYPQEIKLVQNKSCEEVIEILDDRVFDLVKKRDLCCYKQDLARLKLKKQKKEMLILEMEMRCDCHWDDYDPLDEERAIAMEAEYESLKVKLQEMKEVRRIYETISDRLAQDAVLIPLRLKEMRKENATLASKRNVLNARRQKAGENIDEHREKYFAAQTELIETREVSDRLEMMVIETEKERQERSLKLQLTTTYLFTPNKTYAFFEGKQEQLRDYQREMTELMGNTGAKTPKEMDERFARQRTILNNVLLFKERNEKLLAEMREHEKMLKDQIQTYGASELVVTEKEAWDYKRGERKLHKERTFPFLSALGKEDRERTFATMIQMSLMRIMQKIESHMGDNAQMLTEMPSIPVLKAKLQMSIRQLNERFAGRNLRDLNAEMKTDKGFNEHFDAGRLDPYYIEHMAKVKKENKKRKKAEKKRKEEEARQKIIGVDSSEEEDEDKVERREYKVHREDVKRQAQVWAEIKERERELR